MQTLSWFQSSIRIFAYIYLPNWATLYCEFQQHMLSLSPCCPSFLKSLMLGDPLHPILLSLLSREICTGVFWGCVVREGCAIKAKEQEKRQNSVKHYNTYDAHSNKSQIKTIKQANKTKINLSPQQPGKNYQTKTGGKLSPIVLMFNLKVLVICPSFIKEKALSPCESLNRSEWISTQTETLKVTKYSKLQINPLNLCPWPHLCPLVYGQ